MIYFLPVLHLQTNCVTVYWWCIFRTLSTSIGNGTETTNKLDDSISVTHFSGLQVPVIKLQTSLMTSKLVFFGKTALSCSFVENGDQTKSVLN